MGKKRVAILLCDEHYPEAIEPFGYYQSALADLFGDQYDLEGVWACHEGQFPSNSQLDADVWVISGSKYSVNDTDEWVSQLEALVVTLDKLGKQLLGICFGHQMVHKALGGKVGMRESGFAAGVRTLQCMSNPNLLATPPSLTVLFVHQEEVQSLGNGFSVIGQTEHCDYALTTSPSGHVTMQFHPEFTIEFFIHLSPFVDFDNKEQTLAECQANAQQYQTDRETMIEAIQRFYSV